MAGFEYRQDKSLSCRCPNGSVSPAMIASGMFSWDSEREKWVAKDCPRHGVWRQREAVGS